MRFSYSCAAVDKILTNTAHRMTPFFSYPANNCRENSKKVAVVTAKNNITIC